MKNLNKVENAGRHVKWLGVMCLLCGLPEIAMAQAATFTQLSTTLATFLTVLQGVSIATVTISIMWGGYKTIFKHGNIGDLWHLVLGAVLIGGAATLAQSLLGSTT